VPNLVVTLTTFVSPRSRRPALIAPSDSEEGQSIALVLFGNSVVRRRYAITWKEFHAIDRQHTSVGNA
jgi:hypothetical protein